MARRTVCFSPINAGHYAKILEKIPNDEADNTDPVVLAIHIRVEMVQDFLTMEMNMPQDQLDCLLVETTWTSDQKAWQTVLYSLWKSRAWP